MTRRLLCVFLVACLAWSLVGCGEEAGADPDEVEPYTGHLAPGFTLRNTEGTTVRLYDLRGHPVLINFWATFCPPCKEEMPAIQAAYQAHQSQGLVVLGVDQKESVQMVRDFASPLGITFPLLIDPFDTAGQAFQVTAVPESFFIDAQGEIRDVVFGAMTSASLETHLKSILGGSVN